MGRAKAQLKNWRGALQDFETALKLNPVSIPSRIFLAQAKKELKEFGGVENTFELYKNDPDWGAWVSYQLGDFHLLKDDKPKARDWFETALSKDLEFVPAWRKLLSTKWG
jgi:hypothetical protein